MPHNTGLQILLGILLMVLGIFVLGAQVFTTFATMVFLGWMLIIGGVVELFCGFFSGSWITFFVSLLVGVFSLIFGTVMVANPEFSAVSVTLLIGILLLIKGTYDICSSLYVRQSHWGWSLGGGVVVLLLGISMLSGWPYTGSWVIGFFIGIELFISGFVLLINTNTSIEGESTYSVDTAQTTYLRGAKGGGVKKTKNYE